jgi:hypothetical protein
MPSIRRTIRKSLLELLESKTATTGERLKACGLLLKIASAPKGKPRGKGFKKADVLSKEPRNRLDRILSAVPEPN